MSAAVLSAEDSRRMFGADLDNTDVQPVWIEIRNRTSQPLWLLRPGTDPDYFSPLEVAWSLHTPLGGEIERTDRRLTSTSSRSRIRSSRRDARGSPLHEPGAPDEAPQCRSAPDEAA